MGEPDAELWPCEGCPHYVDRSFPRFRKERITCRPADLIPPQLPQFEKECAQWKQQDEDVLSYALFPQVAVDFFKYRLAQQEKVDLTKADTANGAYPA